MGVRLSPVTQLLLVGLWSSLPSDTKRHLTSLKDKAISAVQSLSQDQREALHAEVVRISKSTLNVKG